MFACECGVKLNNPKMPVHCRCGRVHRDGTLILKCDRQRVPFFVRMLRMLKSDADTGPGDTAQRILAEIGGEQFKALAKQIGMPCNCTRRQAEWNERWPYF